MRQLRTPLLRGNLNLAAMREEFGAPFNSRKFALDYRILWVELMWMLQYGIYRSKFIYDILYNCAHMQNHLHLRLDTSPDQQARLLALQAAFARLCNALAPVVRDTRCWNRVALHHMTYKGLREQFPEIGSQMVCNAIYSVCRASRLVYQHPKSPFNVARLDNSPLPLLRFADSCPVYFDRHTLSLKAGQVSMYTLDGRMRFQLALRPEDEAAFHEQKLREIVLSQQSGGGFELAFSFAETDTDAADAAAAADEIPEYLMVEETA